LQGEDAFARDGIHGTGRVADSAILVRRSPAGPRQRRPMMESAMVGSTVDCVRSPCDRSIVAHVPQNSGRHAGIRCRADSYRQVILAGNRQM
jgi:hypothetical protein